MLKTLTLLLLLGPGAEAADLKRGPYLENMGQDMVTVRFRTDESTVAWVTYGSFPDCQRFMTLAPSTKEHKITLFGLLPDTTHCYRVFLTAPASTGVYKAAESYFRTFPAEEKPYFNFLAFGDSGSPAKEQKEQLEMAELMKKFDPFFILHTGDMVETGLDADADAQFFTPYKDLLAHTPFFVALGNHDYGPDVDKPEGKGFLRDNFLPFHSMPLTGLTPHSYYFDLGSARFIALDTNAFGGAKFAPELTVGSKQYKWLEAVLAKSQEKTWRFVFLHHPVYTTGYHGMRDEETAALAPLFEQYKVDVVFQGHDHNYERTKPIKEGAANDMEGVVYVTLAGGGRPLYFQRENADWSEKFLPVFHFSFGEVKDKNFKLTVYNKDGKEIDTLEIQK